MSTLFKKTSQGFTLVEIIVSLAIFTMVSVVSLGAFLRVIDANKKAQSLKTAINNLNFVLDSISRDMKEGREFYCGATSTTYPSFTGSADIRQECTDGQILAFRSSTYYGTYPTGCYLIHAYRVNVSAYGTSTIQRAQQMEDCDMSLSGANSWVDVTAPGVSISNVFFTVIAPTDQQPRAHVTVKGIAGTSERTKSEFSVQTAISPHIMNN